MRKTNYKSALMAPFISQSFTVMCHFEVIPEMIYQKKKNLKLKAKKLNWYGRVCLCTLITITHNVNGKEFVSEWKIWAIIILAMSLVAPRQQYIKSPHCPYWKRFLLCLLPGSTFQGCQRWLLGLLWSLSKPNCAVGVFTVSPFERETKRKRPRVSEYLQLSRPSKNSNENKKN